MANSVDSNQTAPAVLSGWATSWENLFMPYASNKDQDQTLHPRSQTNAFVIRCLDSIIHLISVSKISSLYLTSVAVQASLSLLWSQIPTTGFLVTRLIVRPVCWNSLDHYITCHWHYFLAWKPKVWKAQKYILII